MEVSGISKDRGGEGHWTRCAWDSGKLGTEEGRGEIPDWETGVEWKVYKLIAAQLPSSQKTENWEMLKRYWRVLEKIQILTCGFPNEKAGLPIDYPLARATV